MYGRAVNIADAASFRQELVHLLLLACSSKIGWRPLLSSNTPASGDYFVKIREGFACRSTIKYPKAPCQPNLGARMQPEDRATRERLLHRAVLAGDERAWQTLYEESFNALEAYVRWRCGGLSDHLEETVQET